jgi:tetratricopeptide (TPR) repeat protein
MLTNPVALPCRSRLSSFWTAISMAAVAVLASVPAAAAATPAAPAATQALGGVPAEILASPLPLRQGIGNSHEAVSTRFPGAQAFYDQGLNYLEGYVWIEAARSFHQALRLDADLAMAHVGLSRTYSGLGDRSAAESSLQRAKSLLSRVSPREQRRILLREKQLLATRNIKDVKKFDAYKKAIDDALRADCDPELWLLRGNAEEPDASGRGQYGTAASLVYYHHVLCTYPEYAAAHHFLANTYEALGQADSALAHGEAYARLAPEIPQAAHMLGNALRHAGRVKEAIAQFEKADSLELAYSHAGSIDPKTLSDSAARSETVAGLERKGERARAAGLKTYGSVNPARAETTR